MRDVKACAEGPGVQRHPTRLQLAIPVVENSCIEVFDRRTTLLFEPLQGVAVQQLCVSGPECRLAEPAQTSVYHHIAESWRVAHRNYTASTWLPPAYLYWVSLMTPFALKSSTGYAGRVLFSLMDEFLLTIDHCRGLRSKTSCDCARARKAATRSTTVLLWNTILVMPCCLTH
eukprot:GHUV01023970.1.p1 GENE.GHUV01023970.1~~GHUV01023970.1.p1  ORF type:complete len:173 (-),score=21.47 GHUV01023970.1:411-929(-)